MTRNYTKFNLTIKEELIKDLKIQAIERGMTTSDYINMLIMAELDNIQEMKKERSGKNEK